MRMPFAIAAAVPTLVGLATWIAGTEPSGLGAEGSQAHGHGVLVQSAQSGGSAVPCAVPLSWRIARVDDEFGLGVAEARTFVQEAGRLWEDAVGRTLFSNDSSEGFPVRLVYDDRQARTRERIRRRGELDDFGETLEAGHTELNQRRAHAARTRAQHQERLRDYEQRLSDHNAVVRDWNAKGGAPNDVWRELRAASDALAAERRELEADRGALESERRALGEQEARLNQRADEFAQQAAALAKAFPPLRLESGQYREVVVTENGRVTSVRREIRIYRFAGPDELRLVIAHELGHALGLGHSSVSGAVMSEEYGRMGDSHGPGMGEPVSAPGIQPSDLELIRSRCPALVTTHP